MKNVVIFFGCHGQEIYTYMSMSPEYNKLFQVKLISINEYILNSNHARINYLTLDHQALIRQADVLIIQIINRDIDFFNNSIAPLCSPECTVIKIPHYRSGIYNYQMLEGYDNKYVMVTNWSLPDKIMDICDQQRTRKIIQEEINNMNNYPYHKSDLDTAKKCKLDEFIVIDMLSDITMNDYYMDNYQKYRLFKSRDYPSSIFFYELTNRILTVIDLSPNTIYVDTYYAENTSEPIPEYWYHFCEFTFDNICYVKGHIKVTELEWYHMVLISGDVSVTNINKNKILLERVRCVYC